MVTLDPDKALAVYEQWRQTYPRDTIPLDDSALTYSTIGQHEKALDFASQALRLDPKDRYAYDNLTSAYLALNRLDEAKSLAEQAVAQKLDGSGVHQVLTDIAYIRGDQAAYDHEIARATGTSEESFMLFWKASGQVWGSARSGSRPR